MFMKIVKRDLIINNECNLRIEKNLLDTWGIEVNERINGCTHLVTSEAGYHQDCRVHFSAGKCLLSEKPKVDRHNSCCVCFFVPFLLSCLWFL